MPVRIYEIAKELKLENKVVLSKAKELGISAAKVASSSLDKITAEYLRDQLLPMAPGAEGGAAAVDAAVSAEAERPVIIVPPAPAPVPEPVAEEEVDEELESTEVETTPVDSAPVSDPVPAVAPALAPVESVPAVPLSPAPAAPVAPSVPVAEVPAPVPPPPPIPSVVAPPPAPAPAPIAAPPQPTPPPPAPPSPVVPPAPRVGDLVGRVNLDRFQRGRGGGAPASRDDRGRGPVDRRNTPP
ncbi:MAG: translation initiation factor IF-2 N-terminal domain-containing protein, partial [Verrucomicrobia bacterium]|nr:translation initiation factor IF-2 N-terminal domain-containing protein [Verrucomicrobiota bacterium]